MPPSAGTSRREDGFINTRRAGPERLLARGREVRCLEHFSVQARPGPRWERSSARAQRVPGADVRTGSRVPAASVDPAVSPAPLPSSGRMNFWGGGQRVPSRGARPREGLHLRVCVLRSSGPSAASHARSRAGLCVPFLCLPGSRGQRRPPVVPVGLTRFPGAVSRDSRVRL